MNQFRQMKEMEIKATQTIIPSKQSMPWRCRVRKKIRQICGRSLPFNAQSSRFGSTFQYYALP